MTPYDQEIQELQERVRTGIGRNGYETWLLDRLIPMREGYLAAVADYADLVEALEGLLADVTSHENSTVHWALIHDPETVPNLRAARTAIAKHTAARRLNHSEVIP